MKIDTIIHDLDSSLFPDLQEKYDNSGPQIIFRGSDVSSILISLDIDAAVLDEAISKKCGLIVSHHPLFFKELRRIDTREQESGLVVKIIDSRINVYSAHTNLDKLFYDRLANTVGLGTVSMLFPQQAAPGGPQAGFGAVADLEKPLVLREILAKVKESLSLDFIVYTGKDSKQVKKIAFLNGAGGRSIERIIRETDADCIVTGDVGYHQAKFAADNGIAVIDAGHFGTEIIMLGFLREHMIDCLTNRDHAEDIPIYISESEKDPFNLYGVANE